MPATTSEDADAHAMDVDAILEQLCEEFEARNGRAATEEEMKQWTEQLRAAIAEGAFDDAR